MGEYFKHLNGGSGGKNSLLPELRDKLSKLQQEYTEKYELWEYGELEYQWKADIDEKIRKTRKDIRLCENNSGNTVPSEEENNHKAPKLTNSAIINGNSKNKPKSGYKLNKEDDKLTYKKGIRIIEHSLQINDAELDTSSGTIYDRPMRIRGIAGSGKTIKICQMAAYYHKVHPEWNIALVFNTRSMYDYIHFHVSRYCKLNGISLNEDKLKIMHAWGGSGKEGLYHLLCKKYGIPFVNFGAAKAIRKDMGFEHSKDNPLAYAVRRFLKYKDDYGITTKPIFDAIFIDEGQDLVIENNELLYEGRQPIYWMIFKSIKPVDKPSHRRLIWAYDEYQNVSNRKIPAIAEIFGERNKEDVPLYNEVISHIMRVSYRNPSKVLIAAHALGMGFLSDFGMLSGPTSSDEWEKLGYKVEGHFRSNNKIKLSRPAENSKNPISEYNTDSLVKFKDFENSEQEYKTVAKAVSNKINNHGIDPDNILIISLGSKESLKKIGMALSDYGVDFYISSTNEPNSINKIDQNPSVFSVPGCVTVSGVNRAKGNENYFVYITDCQNIAQKHEDINTRNKIFIAMTRTKGWVRLTGTGKNSFNFEIYKVIRETEKEPVVNFRYVKPPKWIINDYDDGTYQKKLINF